MEAVVQAVRSYLCCFCFPGDPPPAVNMMPVVKFCDVHGPAVRVSNFTASGDGMAFANTAIDQTRAYWEFTVVEKGNFYVGVAQKSRKDLDASMGQRKFSWGLDSGEGGGVFEVGDVVGISFDVSQGRPVLQFFHNGEHIRKKDIRKAKGEVCPAVSVSSPCMLEANFGHQQFRYGPPDSRFDGIIYSQNLI